ncbi:MAG: PA14 domain-containing protein [Phycisphaerae bacterium]
MSGFSRACCLAAAIAAAFCASTLRAAETAVQTAGSDAHALAANVLDRLNLRDGTIAGATVVESIDQTAITLHLPGETREIVMTPYSLRDASFRVLVDAHGELSVLDAPPVTTWRGSVVGDDGALVAASMVDGDVSIAVYPTDAPAWFVQSLSSVDPTDSGDSVVVYQATDVLPGDWRCGVADVHASRALLADGDEESDGEITDRGAACLREALIAFDADYEFFQQNGSSVVATIADIELVMNSVELIYSRDAGITYAIGTVIVRSTDPDPYTQGVGGDILNEFRNHWRDNHTDVPRDIAHMMTGRTLGNGVIGVAWLSQICAATDGVGYGFSQSRFTTDLASRVGLTAHEIGHNWSAGHCDGDNDCSIMCSGLGGCAGDLSRFGTRSLDAIMNFRNSRPCLDDVGPYPTPLPPRARGDAAATVVGQALRIDVLANDLDGNCDAINIGTFAATSFRGGSIVRSIGTGPGGRDELLYTPPASGATDRFTYNVTDGALSSANATVSITLLTPRVPDSPWSLRPGLRARYYSMEDQFVPDYSTRTSFTTNVVPTIDFPSTDGNFATSGRADFVGGVFTGTLDITTAGDYRFFTESDDGSILYVNDRVVVANDGFHGMAERTGIINLPIGTHAIRVEHFEGGGGAGLIARIEGPGLAKQVIPAAMWSAPGVTAAYYAVERLPDNLPSLNPLTPYHEDVAAQVNLAPSQNIVLGSGRRFSVAVQFSGYFFAAQAGVYTFSIESDDGSRFFLGTAQLINNDGFHGMRELSAPAALLPGYHEFRINWIQGGGDSGMILRVEGPGLSRQIVPASLLFSEIPDDCDRSGVSDRAQTTEALDVGDMIAGGNGRGTAANGRGVRPRTGIAVGANAFGESGANAGPVFNATDGAGGRASLPLVNGVFLPRGVTPISTTGLSFLFSPTAGEYWDAIRGDVAYFNGPLATIDSPAIGRGGVGMHANGGCTIDLDAVRAANPGRQAQRFDAVVGVNTSVVGVDTTFEIWVLVDGEVRYRDLFAGYAKLFERISIALDGDDRFLTLATTDAGSFGNDQAVFADAKLYITSPTDLDGNGLPDACECEGDVNADGTRDLIDLATLLRWFGTTSDASRRQGDLDLDSDVDLADLAVLLSVFGASCP